MDSANIFKSQIFDIPIRYSEVILRQIYWRSKTLQNLRLKFNPKPTQNNHLNLEALKNLLKENNILSGSNLMLHSRLEGITLDREGQNKPNQLALATTLLNFFIDLVGKEGTLTMPTHPLYKEDPGFQHNKQDLLLHYDPKRTPSKVGILTELFRRNKKVIRSDHPLSSLCALGPQSEYLIENNLNTQEPLPHGIDSGYYKFSKIGGKVVSLNLPLIKALALVHTPEELKDTSWPIKNFFYTRQFIIKKSGIDNKILVRERDPKWVLYISLKQLQRDLVREKILRQYKIGSIRVDIADSKCLVEYMSYKNSKSTYPYYLIPKKYYK